MLKKLTTTTLTVEKKEVTERAANICITSNCLPICSRSRLDVYVETFNEILSGF